MVSSGWCEERRVKEEMYPNMSVIVCVRVCVRACVRACVCARVCILMCVCGVYTRMCFICVSCERVWVIELKKLNIGIVELTFLYEKL